jgi:2-C-methyl-D-erythritol 4-phosphate cytidylyltransferase
MKRNKEKTHSAGAIIVAAGDSTRMGGEDKLFARLGGKPLLARVVDAFDRCPVINQIILVTREEKLIETNQMITRHNWFKTIDVCIGGSRRQDSVIAGLEVLSKCDWVVIHDGARPLVNTDLIVRGLEAARETGAAVAAVPVTDTIKVAGEDRIVQYTPSRESLWVVQTPQVFRFNIITKAYKQVTGDVTDDASLVEKAGHQVKLYQGSYENVKITTPDDLALVKVLWQISQE